MLPLRYRGIHLVASIGHSKRYNIAQGLSQTNIRVEKSLSTIYPQVIFRSYQTPGSLNIWNPRLQVEEGYAGNTENHGRRNEVYYISVFFPGTHEILDLWPSL